MDYSSLIGLAKQKDKEKKQQPIKGFSTAVTPAKKPPRSHVPSAAVQAFLQKKEQQEKDKLIQARKEKDQLLTLRSQNSKSNKAAKLMASRTKDNDFSRIRLTEDQVEAQVKREAEIRRQVINDKVERMKTRIKMEEQEALLPHKRKRKSKPHDMDDAPPSPSPSPPPAPRPLPNGIKKTKFPTQPSMSFADLMKIASVKQFEDPDEEVEDEEEYRPMTKSEKMVEEYKKYKMSVAKGLAAKAPTKINEVIARPPMGKIPKKIDTKSENRIQEAKSSQSSNRTLGDKSVNRTFENRNENRKSEDNRNVNHKFENSRNVNRKSEDNRNENHKSDYKSIGKTSTGKNASRPKEISSSASINSGGKSVHRTFNGKNPSDNRSVIRDSEVKVNRSVESKGVKRTIDNKVVNRTLENKSVNQTPESRKVKGQSENQSHSRMSNIKSFQGTQKPKVSLGRPASNQRNLDEISKMAEQFDNQRSEPQNMLPAERFESAFRNKCSLPAKKARLDLQPSSRLQMKPSVNSRSNETRERPSSHQEKSLSKSSKEINRGEVPSSRHSEPESPKFRKKEPDYNISKSARQSRNVHHKPSHVPAKIVSKVSLNNNWLEDDSGLLSQDNRFQDVQKKSIPASNRKPISNVPQKNRPSVENGKEDFKQCKDVQRRPSNMPNVKQDNRYANGPKTEQERKQENRRPMQQVQKSADRRSVQHERRPDERSQERRPVQNQLKQQDKRIDSRNREDRRPEKRPFPADSNKRYADSSPTPFKKSDPYGKPLSGSSNPSRAVADHRKSKTGPTGSRRPLDTVYPAKSLARNPYSPYKPKLPPITSSRPSCPYMKSDSEDDDEEEEFDDDDDDMDGFIDDGPQPEEEDYSKHIREIFGYDKRRYRFEDDNNEAMETSYAQQMKEEARSRRIGRLEDLEEERRDEEEKKRAKTGRKNPPKKRL